MSSPFVAGMKEEAKALVLEWGKNTSIRRFISVTTSWGGQSGAFVEQAKEILWIQPVGGFSDVEAADLNVETTHMCFQYWSGYALEAKDRLLVSGDTLEYDVIRAHEKESHRFAELKLNRRQ